MKETYIHDYACVSNLGFFSNKKLGLVSAENNNFTFDKNNKVNIARIEPKLIEQVKDLSKRHEKLDRTTQIALYLAQTFKENVKECGISIGSSRAATGNFEKYHKSFIESADGRISALTSPLTTHGNVSSAVAGYLNNNEGINIEHSVTCSSGAYSILDAVAWISAGFVNNFIAGGVEAPLTDFTISQMKALKIYSESECYPFQNKNNTFVLGEGGALFSLSAEKKESSICISGFGTAHEKTNSLTDMSLNAFHIQSAMKKAMKGNGSPDIILAHAPGTLKGDLSELKAIREVFSNNMPYIYSSKFTHGHTFGASGPISLALAIEILSSQKIPSLSYKNAIGTQETPDVINSILINSTGFGGNAVSILVKRD